MSEIIAQRAFDGARDLLALAAAHPRRYPCLLESVVTSARSRHDILFAFPQDALALHAEGHVRDAAGNDRGADFLDALDREWRGARASTSVARFSGGHTSSAAHEAVPGPAPTSSNDCGTNSGMTAAVCASAARTAA